MKPQQWTFFYVLLPMVLALAACLPLYEDLTPFVIERRDEQPDYDGVLNPLLNILMERQQIERNRRGLNADMGLGSRWSSIEQLANQILAREHLYSASSPGRR